MNKIFTILIVILTIYRFSLFFKNYDKSEDLKKLM